jgi:NADPH2:quinone reductase
VGRVLGFGEQVTKFRVGDRVIAGMGWGGFAERVVAKATNTFAIPQEIDSEKAAALMETFGTALHALKDRALLLPGETLVVLGASGGVGHAAVQLGRLFGARVVAVASTDAKRQLALQNGAQEVLKPVGLKDKLKALGGADVILDPVGGTLSEEAFRSLRPGGRHLVVGFASGQVPAIPLNLPLLKSASLVGVFWGHFWRTQPAENRKNIRLLIRWLEEEKINPHISRVYPVQEAITALEDLQNRKAIGKILLKF